MFRRRHGMARRMQLADGSVPLPVSKRGIAALLLLGSLLALVRGDEGAAAAKPTALRPARIVVVPLPITGTLDTQIERNIEQVLEQLPDDGSRPVLILEFRPKPGQQGEGTNLGRANSLARYLISSKLSRVRTVAWLPTSVRGHAVLPVLACEEIVMHPDATLGDAGYGETFIDPDMKRDYESIAKQRRTIPAAVVMGMLDKQQQVAKVETLEGVRYVLAEELAALQGKANSIDTTVKDPGVPANYTGRDLRLKYGFVSHLASDRKELAAALQVADSIVDDDLSLNKNWKPVLVRLDGPIRQDKVNFILRTLMQRLQDGEINFVCVEIDSAGGSLADSVRLSQYLAELNASNVRTVAFVPRQARGDAAMIAIACDQLVMTSTAVVGGPGEANLNEGERDALPETIMQLTSTRSRSWSLPLALVDPATSVARYVHEGDQRVGYFTEEERLQQPQPDTWSKTGDIDTSKGLTGAQADELQVSRYLVENFDELKQVYHFEQEPERLHANWAHLLIEQLARPEISSFLLFVAFFALMFELMSPGIGLPGFVSAVCFLLFFWAHVLHGTAGTLEIVLFVGGIAFIAIEMFALPGFGVFGIGGVLMVISSVVLASQTFVIPRNAYQLEQLPQGLTMVFAAGAGVLIALVVFRKFIKNAPIVNRMLLQPPEGEALDELNRRESLATFDHLLHKRGTTLTPLTPAGKARFGDDYVDVISDGQFLPRDASVYVIETSGSRVVVRALE